MNSKSQSMQFISMCLLLFTSVCCADVEGKKIAETAASNINKPLTNNRLSKDDFDKHIAELKKKLPNKDFNIVVQSPFVVIGDDTPEAVKQHSERTVKWAVDKLKKIYFSKDPTDILDIWLFKNEIS